LVSGEIMTANDQSCIASERDFLKGMIYLDKGTGTKKGKSSASASEASFDKTYPETPRSHCYNIRTPPGLASKKIKKRK
jgi:hypothetical protein